MSSIDPMWRLTCVYGELRTENRQRMWNTIVDLKNRSNLPWLVVGHFNEVLWQHEHMSETKRPEPQIRVFRDTLESCGLVDLGFTGVPFTFNNNQSGRKNVRVRLDKAVAIDSWRDLFAETEIKHLTTPCSDHSPIGLTLIKETSQPTVRKVRHYEIVWEKAPELEEIIANTWASLEHNGDLASKFYQQKLEDMSRDYFKDLFAADPNITPDEIVDLFETKVTNMMNEQLCAEFSDNEIADTLF
ncbi:uncharacterized protein LOC106865542 [Brachypodium distachyon]|uniref:uncharacterized protein LOC106865542 n=1 Tax=Brachypodium distachyon TaxID=15368 RepID=UPI00071C6F16|nr:uncharacterized protein LOC106865542 [Brachypodium distachyon]|eukprot:XP_014751193.1 uncharacterized protein LOC106865542 [Brachypodium distachyon]